MDRLDSDEVLSGQESSGERELLELALSYSLSNANTI